MKYVAKTRQELGYRTVFNLLGPIINPAGLDYQMVGIYDKNLTELIAGVLKEIDVKHALVIASEDGMDEISTNAPTKVSELKDGKVHTYEINPADYGFQPSTMPPRTRSRGTQRQRTPPEGPGTASWVLGGGKRR